MPKTKSDQPHIGSIVPAFATTFLIATVACILFALQMTTQSFSEASELLFVSFFLLLLTIFLFKESRAKPKPAKTKKSEAETAKSKPGTRLLLFAAIGIGICLATLLLQSSSGMSGLFGFMIVIIAGPMFIILAIIGFTQKLTNNKSFFDEIGPVAKAFYAIDLLCLLWITFIFAFSGGYGGAIVNVWTLSGTMLFATIAALITASIHKAALGK